MKILSPLPRLGLALALLGAALSFSAPALAAKVVCGTNVMISNPQHEKELEAFAKRQGLTSTEAFANVVEYLWAKAKLPGCYVTKGQAKLDGWKPGTSLWAYPKLEGKAIGGDVFGNKENHLPAGHNYIEADLDYTGTPQRNGQRLVFEQNHTEEAWVTTDHYGSFTKVPVH